MSTIGNSALARRRQHQRGSALLIVFLFAAILAIMLYKELPVLVFEAQRDKEQLLLDRGHEYQQGVRLYVRKLGQYPGNLDALENTNRMRFLRSRYKDPFTDKADWRLLHAGPNGQIIDSKVSPVQNVTGAGNSALGTFNNGQTNGPTQNNLNGSNAAFGGGGFGGNSTSFGSSNGFGNAIGFGNANSSGNSNTFGNSNGAGGNNGSGRSNGFGSSNGFGNSNSSSGNSSGNSNSFGGYYSQPAQQPAAQPAGLNNGVNPPGFGNGLASNAQGVDPNQAVQQAAGIPGQPTAPQNPVSPRVLYPNGTNGSATGTPQPGQQASPGGFASSSGFAGSPQAPNPNGAVQDLTSNPNPQTPFRLNPASNSPLANNGSSNSPFANTGGAGGGTGNSSFGASQFGSSNSSSGFGVTQSGGVAGVASKAEMHSIKSLNDQRQYNLWEFTYDPTKDPLRNGAAALNQIGANSGGAPVGNSIPGTQPGNTNGQSAFGSSGFGGNNTFGNSNSGFGSNSSGNSGFGNSSGFGGSNGFGNNNAGRSSGGFGGNSNQPAPATPNPNQSAPPQ